MYIFILMFRFAQHIIIISTLLFNVGCSYIKQLKAYYQLLEPEQSGGGDALGDLNFAEPRKHRSQDFLNQYKLML